MKLKELSITPYPGRAFLAKSRKDFLKAYSALFNQKCDLEDGTDGYCAYGQHSKDGSVIYLLWAQGMKTPILAHELSHLIFMIFERVGIAPLSSGGEPFCYMMTHLLRQAGK